MAIMVGTRRARMMPEAKLLLWHKNKLDVIVAEFVVLLGTIKKISVERQLISISNASYKKKRVVNLLDFP